MTIALIILGVLLGGAAFLCFALGTMLTGSGGGYRAKQRSLRMAIILAVLSALCFSGIAVAGEDRPVGADLIPVAIFGGIVDFVGGLFGGGSGGGSGGGQGGTAHGGQGGTGVGGQGGMGGQSQGGTAYTSPIVNEVTAPAAPDLNVNIQSAPSAGGASAPVAASGGAALDPKAIMLVGALILGALVLLRKRGRR